MSDDKLASFGPTMAPPRRDSVPASAAPFFIIGADDKPLDERKVAATIAVRAEIKVGDRSFSCPVLLHEVVVLRHYYEARAGSGQVRITAAWVPALERTRMLTHADLVAEAQRMRETFIIPKPGGIVIKSFEMFFGAEPSAQLKRLHTVMREQYEAWNALFAKAKGRLPADIVALHPKVQESHASELITDRELEEIALIADPSRRGLEQIQLAEIKPADIAAAPEAPVASLSLEAIKAEAEASVPDTLTPGEILVDKLLAKGLDETRALGVAALVEEFGDRVTDADLLKVLGSKTKVEQVKPLLG
jgi:hypothetical protein